MCNEAIDPIPSQISVTETDRAKCLEASAKADRDSEDLKRQCRKRCTAYTLLYHEVHRRVVNEVRACFILLETALCDWSR
ncbi:hypothetical protein FIBSPDRAFT_873923 [Athelia psychrophila]|uniref:Uncharacterized protein n=1 Tax=Athelia psychrophila TaxID=1759441 RepID=A0A165Y1A9_9AGAM|nr:hypothetical protein FIBSPDRAFT_873923 [Fibularhizoctonia sp. CBS 109695]